MKSTELRLDNYIYLFGEVDQIDSIGRNEHGDYVTFKTKNIGYYLIHEGEEIVKPIPISEEWLEKFGFKIDSLDRLFLCADYGINPITLDVLIELKNVGDGWFYRNGHFKIDYVHQLQNLFFCLCGEELTLKETL